MAKIGLKYPVVSPMTENGNVVTYGTGFVLAKAISLNISIENSDIKLWADDSVAETDRGFASGTVSLGVDDLYDNAKVMLLDYISGVTVDVGTGAKELSAGVSSPAYVGFGVYGKEKIDWILKNICNKSSRESGLEVVKDRWKN